MYNDLEDKIINSIQPVCPMKMVVHYAVMVHPPQLKYIDERHVTCKLKIHNGLLAVLYIVFCEVKRLKFIMTVCGSVCLKGRDFH